MRGLIQLTDLDSENPPENNGHPCRRRFATAASVDTVRVYTIGIGSSADANRPLVKVKFLVAFGEPVA